MMLLRGYGLPACRLVLGVRTVTHSKRTHDMSATLWRFIADSRSDDYNLAITSPCTVWACDDPMD